MFVSPVPAVQCNISFHAKKNLPVTKEILESLLAQNKSNKEIAEILKVSKPFISNKMFEYGLRLPRTENKELLKIPSLLEQNCSLHEICKITGCGINTVRAWIEKYYGNSVIVVRQFLRAGKPLDEIPVKTVRHNSIPTERAMKAAAEIKFFLEKGLSMKEVAEKCGRSIASVHDYIKRFNLTLTKKERMEIRSELIIKRLLAGVPKKQIQEDLNVSRTTIDRLILREGLKDKIHQMVMEQNRQKKLSK